MLQDGDAAAVAEKLDDLQGPFNQSAHAYTLVAKSSASKIPPPRMGTMFDCLLVQLERTVTY